MAEKELRNLRFDTLLGGSDDRAPADRADTTLGSFSQ